MLGRLRSFNLKKLRAKVGGLKCNPRNRLKCESYCLTDVDSTSVFCNVKNFVIEEGNKTIKNNLL